MLHFFFYGIVNAVGAVRRMPYIVCLSSIHKKAREMRYPRVSSALCAKWQTLRCASAMAFTMAMKNTLNFLRASNTISHSSHPERIFKKYASRSHEPEHVWQNAQSFLQWKLNWILHDHIKLERAPIYNWTHHFIREQNARTKYAM